MAVALEWIEQPDDGMEWIGPFDGTLVGITPIFVDDLGIRDFFDDLGRTAFVDDTAARP